MRLTAATFAVVFAVPMGILAAWNAGTWIDRALMALAVLAFSLPVFLIGYLFIFGFSIQLAWLPVQGFRSLSEGFVPFIRHLILPAVSGGLVYMALIARMTRATMLEVLGEDYIRTARARGVGSQRLLLRHALKNAAVPIVTTIGLGIALLLGGVGVASGFVTVGVIGAASRLEYTAVGPTVNLASRLCSEAAHGEVLIDPRTIELLGEETRRRELKPGEALQLKGFAKPVQSYTLAPA